MSTPLCTTMRAAMAQSRKCRCPDKSLPHCDGIESPPGLCSVFKLANDRDIRFNWAYGLEGLQASEAVYQAKQTNIEHNIEEQGNILRKQEPGSREPGSHQRLDLDDVSWKNMQWCLLSPDGRPSGQFAHTHIKRQDLALEGYKPRPLIGGDKFYGTLPPAVTDIVPIYMDRFMNPDLLLLLLLIVLLTVLGLLVYTSRQWARKCLIRKAVKKRMTREALEDSDPFKGTGFESWSADPNEKWKALVPIYEAENYCMKEYRKKLGMPPGPNC